MISKLRFSIRALGILIASIFLLGSSYAEVEVLGFWKFNGTEQTGETIKDDYVTGEGDSPKLSILGSPSYSADAPDEALDLKGSLKFSMGDCLFSDEPIMTDVEQFGIEVWIKSNEPHATRNIALVENGRGAPGCGYGLLQTDQNTWAGIFNGVTLIESPDSPVTVTGEWTHLALLRDAESFGTQFYVNGELVYSSERRMPVPLPPSLREGTFVVAGEKHDQGDIKGSFVGHIAAVRIFRFAPGAFSPGDLLLQKMKSLK